MKEDAHRYRLIQAHNLLIEAGFVEATDGTWHPTQTEADDHDAALHGPSWRLIRRLRAGGGQA